MADFLSQSRGQLAEGEDWYRKSLTIEEELGDRPGMAVSTGIIRVRCAGDRCQTTGDAVSVPVTAANEE
jgi:hypothetical protein